MQMAFNECMLDLTIYAMVPLLWVYSLAALIYLPWVNLLSFLILGFLGNKNNTNMHGLNGARI
jgi:hypothetical protein